MARRCSPAGRWQQLRLYALDERELDAALLDLLAALHPELVLPIADLMWIVLMMNDQENPLPAARARALWWFTVVPPERTRTRGEERYG